MLPGTFGSIPFVPESRGLIMSQSNQALLLEKDAERQAKRRAQFEQHLTRQPGFVKGLHTFLKGFEMLCFVIAGIAFVYGLYTTVRWLFTGDLGQLPVAWATYGLSMSLLVLPMGLDVLLLRVWPADMGMMSGQLDADTNKDLTTGFRAILIGIAVTFGGLPGLFYMTNLAIETINSLF